MNILCDTHILIWAMIDSKKLTKEARSIIENAHLIYLSSASLWEISIKVALGKMELDLTEVISFLEEMNIRPLPITWKHSIQVEHLPFHHHDPFDRMLIAQAMMESLVLLTHDKQLASYTPWVKCV